MRFYIIALLLAYIQSSILATIFRSVLIAPDLLLAYLFFNLMQDDSRWLRKVLFSGLLLDLFQDSLGLNLSGYLVFAILLKIATGRFELPGRLSLLFAYVPLSVVKKLLVITLFRIKYYAEISPLLFLLGLCVEILFLYLISKGYTGKKV